MTNISIDICGAQAHKTGQEGLLTTGMVGATATMRFDDAWEGLKIMAVFRGSGVTKNDEFTGGAVRIPVEVLAHEGYLEIGAEGYSPDGDIVIPTVWVTAGRIHAGANATGDPAADPEAPNWTRAVLYAPQELTPERQAQARKNIGADTLTGTIDEVTPKQVMHALSNGRDVSIVAPHPTLGPITVSAFTYIAMLDMLYSASPLIVGNRISVLQITGSVDSDTWGEIAIIDAPQTAGAGEYVFTVTGTPDAGYTADKPYEEVLAAYEGGRTVICVLNGGMAANFRLPLMMATDGTLCFGLSPIPGSIYMVTLTPSGCMVSESISTMTIGDQQWDFDGPVDFTDTINGMIEEKMGTGQGGASGDYELIADLTLEEAVGSFSITTDTDGKPFLLKKYLLAYVWNTPAEDATLPSYLYLSENNGTWGVNQPSLYTSAFQPPVAGKMSGGFFEVELLSNKAVNAMAFANTGDNLLEPFYPVVGNVNSLRAVRLAQRDNFAEFFEIGGRCNDGTVPAGSRIMLWGVHQASLI